MNSYDYISVNIFGEIYRYVSLVGNPWTSMVFQKETANNGGLIIEQWACEEIGKTDLPNWLGQSEGKHASVLVDL
jgi:hypothetical protein